MGGRVDEVEEGGKGGGGNGGIMAAFFGVEREKCTVNSDGMKLAGYYLFWGGCVAVWYVCIRGCIHECIREGGRE